MKKNLETLQSEKEQLEIERVQAMKDLEDCEYADINQKGQVVFDIINKIAAVGNEIIQLEMDIKIEEHRDHMKKTYGAY